MISEDLIRRQSGNKAFTKGMNLFLTGKIKKMQIEPDGSLDDIEAIVEGSSGKMYEVHVTIDCETDEIIYVHCQCPAFEEQIFPICKHCVAVLLKYNQDKMKNNMMAEFMMMRNAVGKGQERRNAWKKPVYEEKTNSEFLELLQNVSTTKLLPLVNRSIYGQVHFEAHVVFDSLRFEAAGVEFKVGTTQMYVLKDIFAFCERIQKLENYAYGQKLKFVHSMEAFDRESQKLVKYLCSWVEQNKIYYRQTVYTSYFNNNYRYDYPKLRYIKLTGKDLEELLLASGEKIDLALENSRERRWNIFMGGYERKLFVEGVNQGKGVGATSARGGMSKEKQDETNAKVTKRGLQLELEKLTAVAGERYYMTFADQVVYMEPIAEVEEILDFVKCMDKCENHLYVNSEDVPLFERTMLPALKRRMDVSTRNYQPEEQVEIAYKIYLDAPQKNMVSARLVAVYGQREYNVFDKNYQKLTALSDNQNQKMEAIAEAGERDLQAELQAAAQVSSYFNAYDSTSDSMVLSDDDDVLYELLTKGIEEFGHLGEVYVSDALKRINVIASSKVQMGVSVSGNVLNLSLLAGNVSNHQLAEILSRYDRKKKYYRLKSGDFVEIAQGQFEALFEMKEGMQLTDAQMAQKKISVPAFRALYLEEMLEKRRLEREYGLHENRGLDGNVELAGTDGVSGEFGIDGERRFGQDRSDGLDGALESDGFEEDYQLDIVRDEKFTKLIAHMKKPEDNDFKIPTSLKKILRPYQKSGYLWLKTLKTNGFGGVLADDMGLGKTLQVITLLESERIGKKRRKPVEEQIIGEENEENMGYRSLIVSPASLVFNWNSELERFAPKLKGVMVIGTAQQRQEIIEQSPEDAVLLTSYDLLKRDLEIYEKLHFANCVIDEAQYIKNHNTQAARAVKSIQADFKLALTGTPVENSLSELWSIFDFVMPGFLYSYTRFRKELELPIVQNQDEACMERLQKMIGPFVLRRLKKNVLTELPDKTEENVFARLEGEQKELYDAHVQRLKIILDKTSDSEFRQSKIQILSELTRLRQLCCDPALVMDGYKKESAKLDLCMEMIQNAVNGGHKILLFSQFTSMLDRIEKKLADTGIRYYELTGATSKEKRAQLVDAFQHDDVPVFCISLKAGGTGLNLTAADIVIHYDPWWNVAAQNQATDRAHRIGQDNPVTVYRLIAKGTIEENIMKLQEKKQELADQVISGDAVGSATFDKDELLELLR
ncbi:MAG: DEAD/DEAH box helicase [Lachnospira sp.]|nr:DEAD/DEAH box helicase [Lachnospira sp.]